jgi:hypothetical protein
MASPCDNFFPFESDAFERQRCQSAIFDLQPDDFACAPSDFGIPPMVCAARRQKVQVAPGVMIGNNTNRGLGDWSSEFRVEKLTNHPKIVSGWMKSQWPVIPYEQSNDPSSECWTTRFM